MAGAVDLMLYGLAIFISPVAVYFKKGVGVQFWVNCCLYCLLGVPGMIHAFYIIHTNKDDKKTRGQAPQSPKPPVTQQHYSNLPSLPHPDRYRPPAPYSPYEDQPPPIPPKREDTLPYDPALHPNATETPIGRAKAVLHTYQIPESTLHPSPLSQRSRRPVPSPEPPRSEPAEPQQPEPEPSSSTLDLNPSEPSYPAEYHPNAVGKNIANAKAVLHTYQIPETTFPAPGPDPPAESLKPPQAADISATTGSKGKSSMWSLRNRGKGLSALDVNSPTAIPTPSPGANSPTPRPRWQAVTTGPSWLRRRKAPTQTQANNTTDEDDGPTTMTMVWDDKYDSLRPVKKDFGRTVGGGGGGGHARSASEPMQLPFPMPPGSVRPVVDRTGTSNTIIRRPVLGVRSESGLDAVSEESHRPEWTMSEGEGGNGITKPRQDTGRPETDTEAARPQRLMRKLSRRSRPRLDIIGDMTPPTSATSLAPARSPATAITPPKPDSPNQARAVHSPWSRHIAPPAVLVSSINEPRPGPFRQARRTSNPTSPSSPTHNDVDFAMGEFGLGKAGDAYSAGSRALNSNNSASRERRSSLGTVQGPMRSPKRLSTGTAATTTASDLFGGTGSSIVPVMRRGLTQGTFGTGVTKMSSSTGATSEEDMRGSKSGENGTGSGHGEAEEELSQDEQVERWIKREDERQERSESQPPTSHGHSSPEAQSPQYGPNAASLFSEESSGFAGIGVGTAHEKGRAGKLEVWDQPDWDGSNVSSGTGTGTGSAQQHSQYHYSVASEPHDDPFRDPNPAPAPSTATHSSYATAQERFPPRGRLSPPLSPRPDRPTRAPPAAPAQSPHTPTKPAIPRMNTFGAGGGSQSSGLLSPPPTDKSKEKGKGRAPVPPPVPSRPSAYSGRAQSPKLPPKPAILRTMSGGDEDDLSAVYARALRDDVSVTP